MLRLALRQLPGSATEKLTGNAIGLSKRLAATTPDCINYREAGEGCQTRSITINYYKRSNYPCLLGVRYLCLR